MTKATPGRKRRQVKKKFPANAVMLPDIPEDDYYSQIPGVYYHFAKLEWRATCRDPFNCSQRTQRTFGVRKYGFYEAKIRAEVAAYEWDKHRQVVSFLKTVTSTNQTGKGNAPTPLLQAPVHDISHIPYEYSMYHLWNCMPRYQNPMFMSNQWC